MILKFGDKGENVRIAQMKLKDAGVYPLGVDGDFGWGTYHAVIAFQTQNHITADGVIGPNTWQLLSEVLKPLPQKEFDARTLLRAYNEKGYKVRTDRFRINMAGIRKDNVYDNAFSDKLVVFWRNEKDEWESRQFKWTTMPGTLGEGVFNPITVAGITGTAALKEGQYLDTWTFVDSYAGWLFYPYFWQTKPVTVYRDGNRNETLELTNPQQQGLFGINLHRMSNNGVDSDVVNTNIASWSIGCQGAPEPTFAEIVELARVTASLYGNVFDYTLFNQADLA